jgi:hypothetical protein
MLNWLIVLPLFGGVVVLPRVIFFLGAAIIPPNYSLWLSLFFAILALWYPTFVPSWKDIPQDGDSPKRGIMDISGYLWFRLLPFLLALFFLTSWLFQKLSQWKYGRMPATSERHSVGLAMLLAFGGAALILAIMGLVKELKQARKFRAGLRLIFFLQTVGSFSATGVVVWLAGKVPASGEWFFIWFPVLVILTFLAAVTLFAGLVDPIIEDDDREWWARSFGFLLLSAGMWMFLGFVSLGFPSLLHFPNWPLPPDGHHIDSWKWFKHLTGGWAIGSGVFGSALLGSGILTVLTRAEKAISSGMSRWQKAGEFGRRIIFLLAMSVFIILLVLGLSLLTLYIVNSIWYPGRGYHHVRRWQFYKHFGVALALMLASMLVSIHVNINRFSAHIAYRNRLVRTFLGASHIARMFNPFTGFSAGDNIHLHEMTGVPRPDRAPARNGVDHAEAMMQRPLQILCGTANLSEGERLAWQERRAVSFTFSALHCGSSDLAYRRSVHFCGPCGITLGTAMAISGAAANSGMGFYSSPLKSFLLTLLNARLGWWVGNPTHDSTWKLEGPTFAWCPLICELFSLTRRTSSYLNLSDGGHFDNTGVYEMIRRRCRRIVLIDAETSRKGIANAAKKARIDFGVEVTLKYKASKGFPFEKFKIRYPSKNNEKCFDGEMVRIYPAMYEGCAFDTSEFKRVNPKFPDEPLIDQWFGESQFESYRKLGDDLMSVVLMKSKPRRLDRLFKVRSEDLRLELSRKGSSDLVGNNGQSAGQQGWSHRGVHDQPVGGDRPS